MPSRSLTRRDALGQVGALVARSAAAATVDQGGRGRESGPGDSPPARPVPRADLVNTLEYEEQAGRRLAPSVFAAIAGSERAPLDRITLRPRMCVPVLDMDLGLQLFGDPHFAPILVGPVEYQQRFHAEGEAATVKGALAAKAAVVVSDRSSVPFAELASNARTPIWYQVFSNDPAAGSKIQSAIHVGCRVVCVTMASPAVSRGSATASSSPSGWNAIGALVRTSSVPLIVKGIASAAAARQAIASGAQGLIVSTYSASNGRSAESPILRLAEIVDAAGKVPVLVDGSFRRGTDIIKALAFGARAVLVARPVMWGLAAYGADGVQGVLEMLQTELARYMGMCGRPRLSDLDRTLVRTHARG